MIVILVLLLQSFLEHTRDATRQNWSNIVRMTIDDMDRANLLADPGALETQLSILEARYGVAGISVTRGVHVIQVGVPPSNENVERIERSFQGAKL
ncbi:MAG TPA: hypothetical protein VGA33_09780, partial [Thermoanaerobaculia bacterium]